MKANSYYSTTRRIEWWFWGCKTEEEFNELIKSLEKEEFKFMEQRLEERRKKRDLLGFLSYDANFKTGTFKKTGITLQRGEVKRTIRKLSLILQIPRTTIIRYIRELEELGLLSVRREKGQTIITLHFYPQSEKTQETQCVDTPPAEPWTPQTQNRGHQNSSVHGHPAENSEEEEMQGIRNDEKVSTEASMDTQNSQSVDTQNGESWTPKSENRGHKKNKNIYEEKEITEEKESNYESNNSDARSEKLDFEEKKERLKVLRQKVREELEFQEVTSLSLQQITEAALKVRKKFAEVYKEKNKNLPAIRSHEFSQLKKLIALSCPDEEALKEWLEALLPKVENFWRIRNDFTRKHGHTFYTFVHTIPEILEGKGRSLVGKGKNEMLEVKVW